jgi:DNA polymerase III alpha subunit (gram-positive type)
MDSLLNPAATIGDNNPPDPLVIIGDHLRETHGDLIDRGAQLVGMKDRLPASCDDADTAAKLADAIKQCTAFTKNSDATRVSAKEPHLAAGRVVDGFFKKLSDPVDAVKQAMGALLTAYQRKVADEERRRREEEARQAAARAAEEARIAREEKARLDAAKRAEEKAAAEAAQLEREATDKASRAAAAEAKKEADRLAAERAEQERENREARDRAAAARVESSEAKADSKVKAAELTRARTDLGVVSSLRTTWVFDVEDADEVPRAYLSVNEGAIRVAIKAATTKDGKCPLKIPGVKIYAKQESIVR